MSGTSRRAFLKDVALAGAAMGAGSLGKAETVAESAVVERPMVASPPPSAGLQLTWVGEAPPAVATGVTGGIPWPVGTMQRNASITLSAQGKELPVQSWPLAFWPDGSLKWSGFASVIPAGLSGPVAVQTGSSSVVGQLRVTNSGKSIVVDTGVLQCKLTSGGGTDLIESMSIQGRAVAGAGQLVCILQSGPTLEADEAPARERFTGAIKKVTVEQSGPVRAVVKFEGMHKGMRKGREWLPFTVRLYFYSGETSVRMVHTIIFDGDQEKDFVRGLGVQFDVPLREEPRNRTVRFAGMDGGLWSEPLQPGGGSVAQETGQALPENAVFAKNAIWDDFKLMQGSPDGFTIVKRTNPKSAWVFSAAGKRAAGLAFAGDLSGGLSVSIKNFWQSYPSGFEIRGASSPTAKVVAWLWSPDAPEMDMRFYDTRAHGLDAAYEDAQPGLSTAYGVARTSELTLMPTAAWPTKEQTASQALAAKRLPLLACSPAYIHSTGVFGVWSLPDPSTAFKKSIEDGLNTVLAFYQRQVDDRSWYGFWQYGDFIHSYSAPRHVWHYDWGGHAWDNTELGAPLWLWYSYLRTGRADLFRMAEAHLRNTSETDVYHLGPMKGLGSRHNVVKWGDGAKEARISQAAHWRIFYYMTADERVGDIMQMAAEAAPLSVANFDPMREAAPRVAGEPKVRIRIGPDWFALAGNWMTAWERTNDTHWRDLILAGVDSLVAMPYGLMTGKPVANSKAGAAIIGFDAATGKLTPDPDPVTKQLVPVNYNLATIQGGAEVMFELVPLLGRKDFETLWLQMARIGVAPADVMTRDNSTHSEGADASYVIPGQSGPRLAAYAYSKTKNRAFSQKALTMLMAQGAGEASPHVLSGPEVLQPLQEDARISTNEAAQTGLSTIQYLELCSDQLPTEAAVRTWRDPRSRPPR